MIKTTPTSDNSSYTHAGLLAATVSLEELKRRSPVDVNSARSMCHLGEVHDRQYERMITRSEWFLSPIQPTKMSESRKRANGPPSAGGVATAPVAGPVKGACGGVTRRRSWRTHYQRPRENKEPSPPYAASIDNCVLSAVRCGSPERDSAKVPFDTPLLIQTPSPSLARPSSQFRTSGGVEASQVGWFSFLGCGSPELGQAKVPFDTPLLIQTPSPSLARPSSQFRTSGGVEASQVGWFSFLGCGSPELGQAKVPFDTPLLIQTPSPSLARPSSQFRTSGGVEASQSCPVSSRAQSVTSSPLASPRPLTTTGSPLTTGSLRPPPPGATTNGQSPTTNGQSPSSVDMPSPLPPGDGTEL